MIRTLFLVLGLLALSGCYDTAYQPHYIISHEDAEDVTMEPDETLL
jgi:hypothetical protein